MSKNKNLNNKKIVSKHSVFCSSCGAEIVLKEKDNHFDNELKCPICKNYVNEKVQDEKKKSKKTSLITIGLLIGSLGLFILGKTAIEGFLIKKEAANVEIQNLKSTTINSLLEEFFNDFFTDYATIFSGENIDILDKYITKDLKYTLAFETNKFKDVQIKSLDFVAVKIENFNFNEEINTISAKVKCVFNAVTANGEIRNSIQHSTDYRFNYDPSSNSIILKGFTVG